MLGRGAVQLSQKHIRYKNMEWEFHAPTHIHSTKTYTVM